MGAFDLESTFDMFGLGYESMPRVTAAQILRTRDSFLCYTYSDSIVLSSSIQRRQLKSSSVLRCPVEMPIAMMDSMRLSPEQRSRIRMQEADTCNFIKFLNSDPSYTSLAAQVGNTPTSARKWVSRSKDQDYALKSHYDEFIARFRKPSDQLAY